MMQIEFCMDLKHFFSKKLFGLSQSKCKEQEAPDMINQMFYC